MPTTQKKWWMFSVYNQAEGKRGETTMESIIQRLRAEERRPAGLWPLVAQLQPLLPTPFRSPRILGSPTLIAFRSYSYWLLSHLPFVFRKTDTFEDICRWHIGLRTFSQVEWELMVQVNVGIKAQHDNDCKTWCVAIYLQTWGIS